MIRLEIDMERPESCKVCRFRDKKDGWCWAAWAPTHSCVTEQPSLCPIKDETPEATPPANPRAPGAKVTTNIFDQEEVHRNCTVQVWHNSITGETSIGWWKNKEEKE